MSTTGGPEASLPDRAQRIAFYRRAHGRRLAALRRTAAGFGAACGLAAALVLVLADDSIAIALLLGLLAAFVVSAAFARQLLEVHDRAQITAPELAPLPAFESLTFHWATAADLPELEVAIDDGVAEANHWRSQDRDDFLFVPRLPGLAAASLWWVVRDRATGELIGGTSCEDDPLDPRLVSIGLWLAPEHRGRGLGAEVLERAVALVVVRLKALGRVASAADVVTSTDIGNDAMRRTAERAGATEVGISPHRFADGSTAEAVRYRFGGAATPASGSVRLAPAPERSRRLVAIVAGLAALLVATLAVRTVDGVRQRHDDLVAAAVQAADDVRLGLYLDAMDGLSNPMPSIDEPTPGPVDTTTTLAPTAEQAELLRTFAGDGEFVVTWSPEFRGEVMLSALRVPLGSERELYTTSSDADGGELYPIAIDVDDGSLVVAVVPAITEAVLLEIDGEDPIALPTIDLERRGGPPGAARAIATVVPGDAAGARLIAVDSNGSRTTWTVHAA